jgi:hypothetical protein
MLFWNLFRPQTLLDALFDDGWGSIGLPEMLGYEESAVHALMQELQPSPNLKFSQI